MTRFFPARGFSRLRRRLACACVLASLLPLFRLAATSATSSETPGNTTATPASPPPSSRPADSHSTPKLTLEIEEVLVDGKPVSFSGEEGLVLPAGRHDLEFRFRTRGTPPPGWLVRYHLEGHEQDWHTAGGEMQTVVRLLDAKGNVISSQQWPTIGKAGTYADFTRAPKLVKRQEPVFVPAGVRFCEIEFNSGEQRGLTGFWYIDDLVVNRSGGSMSPTKDLWQNTGFAKLEMSTLADPEGPLPWLWQRRGSAHIARVMELGDDYGLCLKDEDSQSTGAWVSRQAMPADLRQGEVLAVSWREMYDVGDPNERIVRYRDVPPGKLRFQAIGCGSGGVWLGVGASLPVTIRPYLWSRPWFWPVTATTGTLLFTLLVWGILRRRYRRRLGRLQMQHALEKDRTRIARDIHDDVGAQLTRLTLLSALVNHHLGEPERIRPQIQEIALTSRQLVHSMNEIVWAVDPCNDSLDHLGTYLCRFADEFLAGSGMRALYDIPPVLPAIPLSAEVRHNLFLAVKEALNNALKHAGATEVRITVALHDKKLAIAIADNGRGFAANGVPGGHGLLNMKRRLEEIGGACQLDSAPGGGGTKVHFSWPTGHRKRDAA